MVILINYYPIMVNLENKYCVVVGGGKVATRKITSLLQAKAKITVVSPTISSEIRQWSSLNLIELKEKEFEDKDINGAFLIIAATNSSKINLQVFEAATFHQLINIVDHPDLSNFIVPTVLNRGNLSIAISTSGSSPSLAQKIKGELQEIYDECYEDYLHFLDEGRRKIKSQIKDANVRYLLLKQLLDPIYLELTREGKSNERESRLNDTLIRWCDNNE